MKQIYLIIMTFGLFSVKTWCQTSYLRPVEGYKAANISSLNKSFSVFDIYDSLLYATNGDTIHCFNLNNSEDIKQYIKPDDYMAWPSFLTVSSDGGEIWAGYTVTGNTDDRIYSIDATTGSWEKQAVLPGNYDLEFSINGILVSGLNSTNWSDPASIFLLDTTGSNHHLKVIEIGGSSAGLATDGKGNIYYATNFAATEATQSLYRWNSQDIFKRVNGTFTDSLTPAHAIKITDLPAGASDCDVDHAGNIVFNFNTSGSPKITAVWNGQFGDDFNFDTLAIAESDLDWLTMLKTKGDILEYGIENRIYTSSYGRSLQQLYHVEHILSGFENLALEPDTFYNGSDGSGGFSSGLAFFPNHYNDAWGTWNGWAYSNMGNDTIPGLENQYSAITAGGRDPGQRGQEIYVVSYVAPSAVIRFNDDEPHEVAGFYVTNSTYAALSMKNGDSFSKKFGGEDGNDPDWFKLKVTGMLNGSIIDSVEFFLADFRFEDNNNDYILTDWQWVELSSLGMTDSLLFSLSSSDNGQWGMNTPAYFCMDDLHVVGDNQEPFISDPLETITVYQSSNDSTIDLSTVFSDPDDYHAFSYDIINSHDETALLSVNNNHLVIDFQAAGQTKVTIKAKNAGATITTDFIIGVYPDIDVDYSPTDFEDLSIDNNSFWNGSDGSGSFVSGLARFKNNYNADWGVWSGWSYSNMQDECTAGLLNQYSAIAAGGFDSENSEGSTYGVSYASPSSVIKFEEHSAHLVTGFYVTNSTYSALSIEQGDQFSKKFGGITGNDPDWFKLNIWGMKEGVETDTIEFYLADYRAEKQEKDYIVKTWQWVDVSSLGKTDSLLFSLNSSDVGNWGMNTPAYFCLDNMYIVPDQAPEVVNPIADITTKQDDDKMELDLSDVFEDIDDDEPIEIHVESVSDPDIASIVLEENNLTIESLEKGTTEVVIAGTSNGKTVFDTFLVTVTPASVIDEPVSLTMNVYPNPFTRGVRIETNQLKITVSVFGLNGKLIYENQNYTSGELIKFDKLVKGSYILEIQNEYIIRRTIIVKH